MRKEKIIILLIVLVDVLGISVVIPILPFYVKDFGSSSSIITLLFATYSFFSFLSNPLLGSLSDKIGRRPILIASIFSSMIGWIVFASAKSLLFLFIGRIIDGIAAGNFSTAQSYLVDISKDEKERASNLGLIGATFGIGFMMGPVLGGVLSSISHSFPFWCAAFFSLTNLIFAYFYLPETHKNKSNEKINFHPLTPILRAVKPSPIRRHYFLYFIFIFSWAGAQSIFSLYGSDKFGFTSLQIGLLFTLLGLLAMLNQTLLLKNVWLKYFSDAKLEFIMFFIMSIGSILMASDNIYIFFAAFLPIASSQAVLRVVITNQGAGKASPHEKGLVIGTLSGMMSLAMIFAPIISGVLYEINISIPFYFAALVTFFATIVSFKGLKKIHHNNL